MNVVVNPDWFSLLVGTTAVLRGLGAGVICGVVLITLPTRRRLGVVPYARFTRAQYRGSGVKVYAVVTFLGALLTVIALVAAWRASPFVLWSIVASLVATSLGFVGTAGALPAMRRLWRASDDDEALLSTLLDRFAGWGLFSAGWHAAAFVAIVAALVGTS